MRRRMFVVVAVGMLLVSAAATGAFALSRPAERSAATKVAADVTTTTAPQPFGLVSVSPSSGSPGTVIYLSGPGCPLVARLDVFFALQSDVNTPLVSAETQRYADGTWTATLVVPADADRSVAYDVVGLCNGGGISTGEAHPFPITTDVATESTSTTTSTPTTSAPTTPTTVRTKVTDPGSIVKKSGYWMLGADGHVYAFGAAPNLGSAPGPSVAISTRCCDGSGYLVTDAAGDVSAFGSAKKFGTPPVLQSGEHVSTISSEPSGFGYWLFTNRGRVFPYGNAHSYGDMSQAALNAPIIASKTTPTGRGYFMVGADGGVFSFGDARFHGSTGAMRLNAPVVGISPTADNRGYWLVASDGGVFAFGAPFHGSMGGANLNRPVNGLVGFGNGYLMVSSDGGIFDFSDKPFAGSLAGHSLAAPIIGLAAFST